MSDRSNIEWTDATWNPVTGCTKVSPGCDNCYAETLAERFRGTPGHYYEHGFDLQLRPEKLDQPLRWRRPRRVFVNSMSDLFHDDIPDEYIARVWAVMALAPRHTFQVLTKRHGRMRSLLNSTSFHTACFEAYWTERRAAGLAGTQLDDVPWPLPNVWVGVSVENQQWADIRVPALVETPAAVRFLSCEPLLGPVDLEFVHHFDTDCGGCSGLLSPAHEPSCGVEPGRHWGVDWVIVGGESGRNARAMHPDWARSLRDQCTAAGVAFHFKQWGEWAPAGYQNGTHLIQVTGQVVDRKRATVENPYGHGSGKQDLVDRGHPGWQRIRRPGKKSAGRVLDGRTWDEFPGGAR
jgi:protein gp37